MKLPKHAWEAGGLGAAGIGLLLLALPGVLPKFLHPTQNAYLWQRADVLAQLCFAYGLFVLFLALWSGVLGLRGTSLKERLRWRLSEIRSLIRNDLSAGIRRAFLSETQVRWLLVILCVGVAVRGYFLAQPMRYDESNTFLHFVNGNLLQMFFYPFPNNHVLHTILVKIVTTVFGAHPATIRIPAFLAGVASIPLIFCAARVLRPDSSAIFATAAMATFPYLVLYSTTARGYTLIVFFTLLLVLVGALTARRPSKAAATILSIIAALGMLTLPSMAFPVAGIYLWLTCLFLIQRHKLGDVVRDFLAPCAFLTVGFAAVFYTPVILVSKGIAPVLANEYVAAKPSEIFFAKLPHHLGETLGDFSRDVPALLLIAGIALIAIGVYRAARLRDWPILTLLPAALLASASLLLFKHAIPYPRTWIFLLPLAFILANSGWMHCLEKLSAGLRTHLHRGFITAAAVYALWLISTNAIARYEDTGVSPHAHAVASYLKPNMKNGDKVQAAIPINYPLFFYLWYHDVRDFRGEKESDEAEFVIVQRDSFAFEPSFDEPVVKLADVGDLTVYRSDRDSESPAEANAEEAGTD